MRGATSLLAPEFADWMLGSMSSGVIAIDTDERVVRVNDGARRVLRLTGSVSEISGRPCAEVLSEQPAAARVLVAALSGQRPLSRAELVLDAPMGQPAQTIGFTLTTVRDDRGGMRGVAMIFRDLTPFERSDEQARLQDRLAALGQMAAGLAHEIRNPLAGMEVVAGLLKRRLADLPDECALVDQITAELRSVADTVSDALGYVRPVVSARAPVDLSALVAEAIEVARTRVEFAGKVVREERGRVDPISADPEQLRAVVTNLVVNAFEAMEGDANACLDVTVEESESTRANIRGVETALRYVVLTLGDNGPGIPDDIREKVFYPFFTTKQTGSGVGLASAQKVVASHGGTIELDSRSGKGAVFRVRLPAEEPHTEQGEQA